MDSWLGPLAPLSLFSSLPSVFLASLLSFFSDFSDFFSSFLVDGVLVRKETHKCKWGKFNLKDYDDFRRHVKFLTCWLYHLMQPFYLPRFYLNQISHHFPSSTPFWRDRLSPIFFSKSKWVNTDSCIRWSILGKSFILLNLLSQQKFVVHAALFDEGVQYT